MKKTKVVVNRCYGGFGLSQRAFRRLIELGVPSGPYYEEPRDTKTGLVLPQPKNDGIVIFTTGGGFRKEPLWSVDLDKMRSDPRLIQVVEELGSKANGRCAKLQIVEIPDGIDWEIEEYDGQEWVSEKHRTW